MSKPLYKIGDKVLVKSKYDKGCTSSSYRFSFVSYMLSNFGGNVYKIKEIVRYDYYQRDFAIPDDGYQYQLDKCENYKFSSSMFEPEF